MQTVAGALNAVCGLFLCWLAWYLVVHDQLYGPGLAFFGAAQLVFGLGLTAFRTYRNERLDRGESLEGREGWRLLTPRWWGVLVMALAAGAAYAAALWRWR
ncbi:MAG TPA: hypothetical protein VFR37_05105 [Longimicrobium sp.]|nr:hypothetical protein [Longimicrobium sp.]